MKTYAIVILLVILVISSCQNKSETLVFQDGFEHMQRGPLSSYLGAQTEYQYLPEARPHGDWAVATFRYEGERANVWSLREDTLGRYIYQKHLYEPQMHWHPMMVAGSEHWKNYRVELDFIPEDTSLQSGLVFRYHNSRCYYFWGVQGNKAVLKLVNYETAFRVANEKILAEKELNIPAGTMLKAWVKCSGNRIQAGFGNGPELDVIDSTFQAGKIAILADVPARFYRAEVYMTEIDKQQAESSEDKKLKEEKQLQKNNPKPVVWKKIHTTGFGTGRNVRFGDLNNDGQTDVLIGQIENHGPKDRNSEISCLTAMTFDGEILWQSGIPDSWKTQLTSDVAFQIHDIDKDGKTEVIYTHNKELLIADGATGKIIKRIATPVSPDTGEKIWGDCLYFCDFTGKGYDSDLVIKDRYKHLWAYSSDLKLLWHTGCTTGHYPFAKDIDGDGKDELMIGYTLFDDDGKVLWQKDSVLQDHADGVAIVDFDGDGENEILIAGSDEGMIFSDTSGKVLAHYRLGHVQNPAVANFRDDLPGLETITINFWGNQGLIHFYDSGHTIYHDFEPNHYGSMCLPANWAGKSEEFFVHNTNVEEGGMFDGWGRKVVDFPDDGHPDRCNAVLDITGDCRDEIVVWDQHEMWVYSQSNNPLPGKLYQPVRNELYNYSNYQATVSLPTSEK